MCKPFLDVIRLLPLFTLDDLLRCGFLRRFLRFRAFSDHRVAFGAAHLSPRCPAGGFSATLGWASRCAKLDQNLSGPAAHLAQAEQATSAFPRSSAAAHQGLKEHQLVMHTAHQICPALELCRSAQMRGAPQQLLFVEAEAVLLTKASPIQLRDFGQGRKRATNPPEPGDPRVTFGAAGSRAHDPKTRDGNLAGLPQMQVAPAADLYGLSLGIGARPVIVGRALGVRVAPFEPWAVEARSALAVRARGGRTVEHLVFARPAQTITLQPIAGQQPGRVRIATVEHEQHRHAPPTQQRQELAQLLRTKRGRRLRRGNAAGIQDVGCRADRIRQDDQRRELPAGAGRCGVRGQVGTMDEGTVSRGVGIRTQDAADIQAEDQARPNHPRRQVGHEQAGQRRTVDPTIFERFIQAGPGPLNAGGLRQLDEAAGLGVAQQRIGERKQGVVRLREAGRVQSVAKCRQDGRIHRRTSLIVNTKRVRPRAGWRKPACPFVLPSPTRNRLRLV